MGYNPYTYVANNPTTWTDPGGELVAIEEVTLNRSLAIAATAVVAAVLAPEITEAFEEIIERLRDIDTGNDPGEKPGPGEGPPPTLPPPPLCVDTLPGGIDIIPGVDVPILEDCDPHDNDGGRPALFGQARIGPSFADGHTLEETADELAGGTLILPLEVWDRDGTLIALSNRRLAAYLLAGIGYPPIVTRGPTGSEEARLTQTSCLNGGPLPTLAIAVTAERWESGCGEILDQITSIVRKRD